MKSNQIIQSFLIFTLSFSLWSQENKILRGQFIGENLEKSFINVININQARATISRLEGDFDIQAQVGDSILISSIQYKEIKFVVKPEFFEKGIEIPLELKVNELQRVNVYSLGLTGDLKKDVKGIKTYEFDQTTLGFPALKTLPSVATMNLNTAKSSTLDYLLNVLNGDIKLYKILVQNEINEKHKRTLYYALPMAYFTGELKIPEMLVEDFTYYCVENHPGMKDLIRKENKLLLLEQLPGIASEYLTFKENEQNQTIKIDD